MATRAPSAGSGGRTATTPLEAQATPYDPKKQVRIADLIAMNAYDRRTNPAGWRPNGWQVKLLVEADRAKVAGSRKGTKGDGKISVAELQQYLYSPSGAKLMTGIVLDEIKRAVRAYQARTGQPMPVTQLRGGLRDAASALDTAANGTGTLGVDEVASSTAALKAGSDVAAVDIVHNPETDRFELLGADAQKVAEVPNLYFPAQAAAMIKGKVASVTKEPDVGAIARGAKVDVAAVDLWDMGLHTVYSTLLGSPLATVHAQYPEDIDAGKKIERADRFPRETRIGTTGDGRRVVVTSASQVWYEGTGHDLGHAAEAQAFVTKMLKDKSFSMFNIRAQTHFANWAVGRVNEDDIRDDVIKNRTRVYEFTGDYFRPNKIDGTATQTYAVGKPSSDPNAAHATREPSDNWKIIVGQVPVVNVKGAITGWRITLQAYVWPNLDVLPTTDAVVEAFLNNQFDKVDFTNVGTAKKPMWTVPDPHNAQAMIKVEVSASDQKNVAKLQALQRLIKAKEIKIKVPVSDIEAATGFRFFEQLPPQARAKLRELKGKVGGQATMSATMPLITRDENGPRYA
ncbi:MAG: DNA/RNA non-specific endonuclease [Myxococcota bacterium]